MDSVRSEGAFKTKPNGSARSRQICLPMDRCPRYIFFLFFIIIITIIIIIIIIIVVHAQLNFDPYVYGNFSQNFRFSVSQRSN